MYNYLDFHFFADPITENVDCWYETRVHERCGQGDTPARLFSNISSGYKQKVFIIYLIIMKFEQGVSNLKREWKK